MDIFFFKFDWICFGSLNVYFLLYSFFTKWICSKWKKILLSSDILQITMFEHVENKVNVQCSILCFHIVSTEVSVKCLKLIFTHYLKCHFNLLAVAVAWYITVCWLNRNLCSTWILLASFCMHFTSAAICFVQKKK